MPANTTIGRVRIGQRQSTTIASPNWAVKSNLALGDLNNVSTANVENGYASYVTFNDLKLPTEFRPTNSDNLEFFADEKTPELQLGSRG
jgi:hypothetical protein